MSENTFDTSICVCLLESPLGRMVAACTDRGLAMLEFGDLNQNKKELQQLSRQMGIEPKEADHPILHQTAIELAAYFSGKLKRFTIPLAPEGNAFAQSVWRTLLTIPYGETWTYKKQAEIMKNPLAIRAIAAANGRNPIAVIIPCHRVIGSNGSLTGYAGGLEKKKWLLQWELTNSPAAAGLLF